MAWWSSRSEAQRWRRATLWAPRLAALLGLALVIFDARGAPPAVVTTNTAGALVLTNHFGDLNDDSQVNVLDLVALVRHLAGIQLLPTNLLARADLNQDGRIDHTDRRILADLIAHRHTGPEDDFDNDELSNADEVRLGTNPFDPDTDHDGSLDGWEVIERTDPLDPLSRVQMTIVASPPVTVIYPLIQDTDTNGPGPVVAQPPVTVSCPALASVEEWGAITVGRPRLRAIHPLIQNTDTNAPGPMIGRPPVTVINTNNPAK